MSITQLDDVGRRLPTSVPANQTHWAQWEMSTALGALSFNPVEVVGGSVQADKISEDPKSRGRPHRRRNLEAVMWLLLRQKWRVKARWGSFYASRALGCSTFLGTTRMWARETARSTRWSATKTWPKWKLPSWSWCCCSPSPATCASCGPPMPPSTASPACISSWSTWASRTSSSRCSRCSRSWSGTSPFASTAPICCAGLLSTSRS